MIDLKNLEEETLKSHGHFDVDNNERKLFNI